MINKAFAVIFALLYLNVSIAYEIHTHSRITKKSYEISKLIQGDSIINDFGIQKPFSSNPFGEKYFDVSGDIIYIRNKLLYEESRQRMPVPVEPLTIKGWLMRGVIREDDCALPFFCDSPQDGPINATRPYNHFYDPYFDMGLSSFPIYGDKAPSWALGTYDFFTNPIQDNRFINHFTIFDAQDAMHRALTGQYKDSVGAVISLDESQRKAYWATTFRALGDVIHLVQDMAQPQHTRNDAHSKINMPEERQVFELYTNSRVLEGEFKCINGEIIRDLPNLQNIIDAANYPIPQFTNYSDFFSTQPGRNTQNGKGLADYSNREFFTAGTNKFNSPYPSPENKEIEVRQEIISEGCVVRQAATYFLYDADISDQLNPSFNTRLPITSRSIWDVQDINHTMPRFALIRQNYDAMADNLIPRAVAYSAGLINYFFRGRLDVTKVNKLVDSSGFTRLAVTVKNISSQFAHMTNGTFTIHYDAIVDGQRIRKPAIFIRDTQSNTTNLHNGHEITFSIHLPTDIDASVEKPFIVAYRGQIGEEMGVAGKVFSDNIETALLAWGGSSAPYSSPQIWRSVDDGVSWYVVANNLPYLLGHQRIVPLGLGESLAMMTDTTYHQKIYHSTDNGFNWPELDMSGYDNDDLSLLGNAIPLGIDDTTNSMVLLSRKGILQHDTLGNPYFDNYVVHSYDKGKTWFFANVANFSAPLGLSRFFGFMNIGRGNILAFGADYVGQCYTACYFQDHQYATYHSSDYGRNWTKISSDNLTWKLGATNMGSYFDAFTDTGQLLVKRLNTDIVEVGVSSDFGQSVEFFQSMWRDTNWLYTQPLYTKYLGEGKMLTYIYDGNTYIDSNTYPYPYYEGIMITEDYGQTWRELTSRASTAGGNQWPGTMDYYGFPSIGALGIVSNDYTFFEHVNLRNTGMILSQ